MKKNVWIFGSLFAILLAGAITLTALVLHKPVEPADKPVQTVQGQPEQSDVEPAPKTGQNSVDLRDIDYTPQYPKHDSNVPNDDQPNENQTSDQVPDQPDNPGNPTVDPVHVADPRENAFALRLLQECYTPDKNICLSPFSMEAALALTANGARGETREQIEKMLSPSGKTIDEITAELKELSRKYEESDLVKIANSVWIKESEADIVPEYREKVTEDFGADLFPLTTIDPVNQWALEKTDGMIRKVLDKMPENAVFLLANAVCFDAKWSIPYATDQVKPDVFHTADGKEQPVEMMTTSYCRYLEDDLADGFAMSYDRNGYGADKIGFSFAVIVPKEGVSLQDYIMQMKDLSILLPDNRNSGIGVHSYLPKFAFDYKESFKEILPKMGMTTAFTWEADFSDLVTLKHDDPLFIDDVTQNTRIEVAEEGTRAAAVTVAIGVAGGPGPSEYRTVRADRPFLFVIYDWKTYTPLFIGAVNDLG